mmetsp:Transcript_24370/g.35438  ORF Transcript_24370/g.35438 Transcript_24370/m.35438 type:complete len:252 (-) Transcript_24370:29-784(-)
MKSSDDHDKAPDVNAIIHATKQASDERTFAVLRQFDPDLAKSIITPRTAKPGDAEERAVIRIQNWFRARKASRVYLLKLLEKLQEEEAKEEERRKRFTEETLDMLDAFDISRRMSDGKILEEAKRHLKNRSAAKIQSLFRWKSSGKLSTSISKVTLMDVKQKAEEIGIYLNSSVSTGDLDFDGPRDDKSSRRNTDPGTTESELKQLLDSFHGNDQSLEMHKLEPHHAWVDDHDTDDESLFEVSSSSESESG